MHIYPSPVRKFVNPNLPAPIARSYFVGIEIEDCDLPAPHHGHVILPIASTSSASSAASTSSSKSSASPHIGPILLYALSPSSTRMLIDISTTKTPTKAYLRENITPLLPSRIQPSFLRAVSDENPQKVKAMPNSFLPPHVQGGSRSREGVLLAGDALNMRHPLTGGGMSVALNDVVILTELLGGGKPLIPASLKSVSNGHANGHSNDHGNGDGSKQGNGYANGHSETGSATRQPPMNGKSRNTSKSSSQVEDTHTDIEPCELQDWWDVRSRLEEWHWRRKGVATCVNVLAMALYCLFGGEGASLISG